MTQETIGSTTAERTDSPGTLAGPDTATTKPTRDEQATQLVDRLSLVSGAAGLIAIPLLDVIAVGGVQLYMLRRLSEIYSIPFSENRGKSILASLAGAMVPASTATTTAMGVSSLIKGVPVLGTAVGIITMPIVSAGATWIIGQVFMKHFASGGTLLDFNPPDYREFIKAQKARLAARSGAAPPSSEPVTSSAASPPSKSGATTGL